MSKKKIKWPSTIALPDNWGTMPASSTGLAAKDSNSSRPMCVSMFLGKRLGVEWTNFYGYKARDRLVRLGYTIDEAHGLVYTNDYGEGVKQAIRLALEMKGYEVSE